MLVKGPVQGREHTDDRQLDAIQQRMYDSTGAAKASVFSSANFIQGLSLVAEQPITIQHGLGRPFVSCLLCAPSAICGIAVQRASTPERPPSQQNLLDARQITIIPGATCTADLLVW